MTAVRPPLRIDAGCPTWGGVLTRLAVMVPIAFLMLPVIEHYRPPTENPMRERTSPVCTGVTETCPIDECVTCSVRDCPWDEPLHHHHDGCPSCVCLCEKGCAHPSHTMEPQQRAERLKRQWWHEEAKTRVNSTTKGDG